MRAAACPFCHPTEPVLSNELAWACYDKNPVTPGHVLIVTRRHVPDWFQASGDERAAIVELLDKARDLLVRSHCPPGFNIGTNIGAASGQTIAHLHVHLIPRYVGDCADPRGGVRGVIPGKQWYPIEGEAT